MTKPIPLHEPVFGGKEWEYAKECLDTGWVSSGGPFVDRFERAIARFTGVKQAVATTNGTAALHLALKVLGVGAGDEVLMPSLTFIATANSAAYQGAVPHFIDVELSTYGLDPAKLEAFLASGAEKRGGAAFNRATGRRLAACMPMHAFGHPARVERIIELCAAWGIPVVEDAAEALGSFSRGKAAGSFGRIGALSFNGNKILTTGGGGMLISDDEALAARARHLSTQAKSDAAAFWHDEVGHNYRMPNVNAALGCAQLEQLPGFLKQKRAIAGWYREALACAKGHSLLWEPEGAASNFWLNTVRFESAERAAAMLERLNENGVLSRPVWAPCHKQEMFRDAPRGNLETTELLWKTSFNLPSSASLPRAAVETISGLLARP